MGDVKMVKKSIDFDSIADLYDAYVSVDFDIPFFLRETENCDGEILELMSGTGRVSIPLLEAGRRLLCVDYSSKMLDKLLCKTSIKNIAVETVAMDVSELALNRQFNTIILPFHSFAEIADKEKQLAALLRIREHLEPKGIFLITLQNPVLRKQAADGETRILGNFSLSNDYVLQISCANVYQPDSGMVSGVQLYSVFDQFGKLVEKRELPVKFRLVSKPEFEEMCAKAGFKIERSVGDYSYSSLDESTSPYMIFWLRRSNGLG